MGVQRVTVHIVGDQQKAQKTLVPNHNGKAKSLEEATLLKASPKSRLKVCKGKHLNTYKVLPSKAQPA